MYTAYIKAGGLTRLVIVLLFIMLHVFSLTATNIWLSKWSDDQMKYNSTHPEDYSHLTNLRLGVYAGFGVFQCK